MLVDMESFIYRAQVLKVVDGDTVDLYIDQGFHSYRFERARLLGVNTPEMHADDEKLRTKALEAKNYMIELLKPNPVIGETWPVMIRTHKSDVFGRWLCDLYMGDFYVNKSLLDKGLAVPFKK